MGFFDFLGALPGYAEDECAISRLNTRHGFLIDAFRDDIAGARVLDLAAHDGRWSYAFAAAGAASVLGVEGRAELIGQFAAYPDAPFKSRVRLRQSDIFVAMENEIAAGRTYDVIAILGVFYHIMDHVRLLALARQLQPRLIIIDGTFMRLPTATVHLYEERTDHVLNAIPQVPGQQVAIKGVPTLNATRAMAKALGFSLTWSDWTALPRDRRKGVRDYFRSPADRPGRIRATCALRPV